MTDEDFTSLSVKAFLRRIDDKIAALIERLIVSEDDIIRGKILAFREVKEILLNKKA